MSSFNNWAFIYGGLGEEDPAVDRAVIERGGLRTTIVAVPDEDAAVSTAIELLDAGAQSIELCGGFGPTVLSKVLDATGARIPVGQVRYGMESVHNLAELFPLTPA